MSQEDDRDLPLHDEAKARSKWRGAETTTDKGGDNSSGPASEVDNPGQSGSDGTGRDLTEDLAERPPD